MTYGCLPNRTKLQILLDKRLVWTRNNLGRRIAPGRR